MYTYEYYGNKLYLPTDPDLYLISPVINMGKNLSWTTTARIRNNHPFFNTIKPLKYGLVIKKDDKIISRMRITKFKQLFDNVYTIYAEDKLAALNDSPCRPFSFQGTPAELFTWFIENHNSQVGDEQKLLKGNVTVTDSNDYITRSWEETSNTWSLINSRLIDTLGGFLLVRYEEDGDYLDWLAEYPVTSKQKIIFGENLVDISKIIDATRTYTACLPYGAKNEEGQRITIASVNGGKDYLINEKLKEEYGVIYAPTEEVTWDDVTLPDNLLSKAQIWLSNEGIMLMESVELSAADMALSSKEINSFEMYQKVQILSEPHGIDVIYEIDKMKVAADLSEVLKITIGTTKKTLSAQIITAKRENDRFYETIDKINSNYVTNEKVTEAIDEALEGTKPYLHIKYSPVESPTAAQMTTAPNEGTIYIGLSHTASENAPTDPTAYTWQKIAGDPGPQGIQGYSVVASVSRPSFTEENWNTYGTIGHLENWSNTENIRNGCRIGDIFTVVGTATDTGKAHVLYYRSTTASGTLYGECIAHSVANKGDMGISVDGVQRYYILQNTEPIKPDSNPPPNEWLVTEPSYEEGSTSNLYFVDCVIFSNKTYTYSNVSLSTSYEAAKAAYNKASIVQEDLNETNKKLDDEINKVKELYSSAIDQSAREIKLEVSKEYATKEDIKTESTRITQLSSSVEIAVKTANDVKNTFQFLPEGFRVGKDNSEIYSIQDNDSFEFRDKSNEPLLTIAAASGVTAPNVNIKKQLTFFEKWAMRKGEYVNGKGYNLNDLWIGG